MSTQEIQARAEKVAAIVTTVPRRFTASKVKAARVADRMAAFTAEQRARWARAANVNAPSDLTWSMVVAAVPGSEAGAVSGMMNVNKILGGD